MTQQELHENDPPLQPENANSIDDAINAVLACENEHSDDETHEMQEEDNELPNWKTIDESAKLMTFDYTVNAEGIRDEILEAYLFKDPYDFFKLFLTDEIINLIVIETNRYGSQMKERARTLKSRISRWYETDDNEIETFLGLLLWMGLCHFPCMSDYWSKDPIYHCNVNKYMSRNRFELLLRVLHFSDNDNNAQVDNNAPIDKLRKIRPLVDLLVDRFRYVMTPTENVCIDETLVPFRGRIGFRQYIKNKRHKFGIKLYKLCVSNGYTYDLQIYCGKTNAAAPDKNVSESAKVVMKLMQPLLDSGRTLFVDNFYTSVSLAKLLLERQTHLVGTLRKKRKMNCKEIEGAKLKKAEVVARICEPGIVILKWKDKREVMMLSTKHLAETKEVPSRTNPGRRKPQMVVDYNDSKSFIDLSDQHKAYNTPLRRGVKWYRKLATELILGTALVNAFVVYKGVTQQKITITDFKKQVLRSILEKSESHPIVPVENTPQLHELQNISIRRRCVICYERVQEELGREVAQRKTPRSNWQCETCEKTYCVGCFFNVHTCVKK